MRRTSLGGVETADARRNRVSVIFTVSKYTVSQFSISTLLKSFSMAAGVWALAAFFCAPPPAAAQEPSGLAALSALEDHLVRAIERSEKSVVSIARFDRRGADARMTAELRPSLVFGPETPPVDPTNPDFIPTEFASGVVLEVDAGDKNVAYIVTTRSDVLGPDEVWVSTVGKQTIRAKVVGTDFRSNLAVLRVPDSDWDQAGKVRANWTPMTLGDASKLKKGQIVIALGNPYSVARDGQASASWGIIANLSRKLGPNPVDRKTTNPPDRRDIKNTLHHFGTLIQTDAKLNFGASGGALLNLKGEMVGLTTSQAAVAGFEQAAGYAIPVDDLFHRVVDTLKQGKEVEYGLLGVSTKPLSPGEFAAGQGGVKVDSVSPGSPAFRAGITTGDIIRRVSGKPIDDVDALMLLVGRQPAGNPTTVTVEKGGRMFTVPVTLAKYEVRGESIMTAPKPAWRGMQVDYTSARQELERGKRSDLRFFDSAVLVTDVVQNSAAWQAGLRKDVFVTHVQNVVVETPRDFFTEVARHNGPVELRLVAGPGLPPVVRVAPEAAK
jgi:serine protease Do